MNHNMNLNNPECYDATTAKIEDVYAVLEMFINREPKQLSETFSKDLEENLHPPSL